MSKLVSCKACGKEIAKSAPTCPHCGAKQGMGGFRRAVNWIGGIVIILVLIGFVINMIDDHIPQCDSARAHAVVSSALEGSPLGRVHGVSVVKITEAEEEVSTEDSRQCQGRALLSNGQTSRLAYRFYRDADGDIMVEAQLR